MKSLLPCSTIRSCFSKLKKDTITFKEDGARMYVTELTKIIIVSWLLLSSEKIVRYENC